MRGPAAVAVATNHRLPTATKVNGTRQKHFVKTTEAAASVRKVDQWICPFRNTQKKKKGKK